MQKNARVVIFVSNQGYSDFIVQFVAQAGYQITVATNNVYIGNRLKVFGYTGQINIQKISFGNEADIVKVLKEATFAINCVEPNSINNNTLHKIYYQLPVYIAKTAIKFINFNSILSNNNSIINTISLQKMADRELLNFKNTLTLKLPTFIVGEDSSFISLGNIIANFGFLIAPKFDKQKICLVHAKDIANFALDYLEQKVTANGIVDFYSEQMLASSFFDYISEISDIGKSGIIRLSPLLFNLFAFFAKFQRVVDATKLYKIKLIRLGENPVNKAEYAKFSVNLLEFLKSDFSYFGKTFKLNPVELNKTPDYYPSYDKR